MSSASTIAAISGIPVIIIFIILMWNIIQAIPEQSQMLWNIFWIYVVVAIVFAFIKVVTDNAVIDEKVRDRLGNR